MRPGDTIAGRFQLLGIPRGGGLSVVVQARDLRTSERVALKIINLAAGGPEFSRRIEREIQIHATFSHPHVVRCLGSGFLADHRPYLVLEWLEGRDLAEWKEARSMPLGAVLELGVQVSAALEAAHARGIVHRDVKPANIFLVEPEIRPKVDVRVIDFGVAKMQEAAAITRPGAILGTLSYMAPEQAGFATDVDERADLFSLGVVLFELITGRLPWTAPSDLARLARIDREPALGILDVAEHLPKDLAELIDSTLVLDPKARLSSARELRSRLSELGSTLSPALLGHIFDARESAAETPATVRAFGVERTQEMAPSEVVLVDQPSVIATSAAPTSDLLLEPSNTLRTIRSRSLSTRSSRPDSGTLEVPPAIDTGSTPRPEDPFVTEPLVETDGGETQDLAAASEDEEAPVLYGRVQELESLRSLGARLLEAVAAGFVLVVGAAGVGKTRVCVELQRSFATGNDPPAVMLGRGDEARRFSPHAFLRRLLLVEAGIRPEDAPPVQRGKLLRLVPSARRLRALLDGCEPPLPGAPYRGDEPLAELWFARAGLGGEPSESIVDLLRAHIAPEHLDDEPLDEARAGLLAFLARALRIPGPKLPIIAAAERAPRRMGEQLRRAMDVVFRGIAELRRLVILADDAHWIDAESARVLADLVKPARANQVVLIAFALPQLLEGLDSTSPLEGRRARIIELPSLDARAQRAMVRGLVPGPIEASTLEGLVFRAAGNALYLQQLVLATLASGALQVSGSGEYELVGLSGDDTDEDLVPPTVSGAVTARIVAMEARTGAVLSAAAVLGEVFTTAGVAALAGVPETAATAALGELSQAGLVQRARAFGRSPAELELTHGVIQSVALSRLKRKRRHKLERAAVEHLETLAEVDHAVLAAHLAQAGLDERAASAFSDAATAALALGSAGSALALAEQGLRLTDRGATEDATRLRLLALLGRAATLVGDDDVVERALSGLEALAESDIDVARVKERRASHAFRTHRWAVAAEAEKAAIEIYRRLRDPESEARALVWHGEASMKRRRPQVAVRSFLEARKLLTDRGHSAELARTNLGLAKLAFDSGDYRTAHARFREAGALAEAAAHPESRFRAAIGLAAVARISGDVPRALRGIEAAAPFADTTERRLLLELERASVLAEEGRMDEAEAALVRVLSVLREHPELGHERRLTLLFLGRAWAYMPTLPEPTRESSSPAPRSHSSAERLAEIGGRLQQALAESEAGDPSLVPALELVLAAVATAEGRFEAATALGRRALERFVTEGTIGEEEPPRVFWVNARIAAASGQSRATVLAAWAAAIEHLDRLVAPFDRKARKRYLDRPIASTILLEAERGGLPVRRHATSHRLSIGEPGPPQEH